MRTEHGEYWIEPSNEIPIDSSKGRPHIIFKRSAVSKEAAWHRSKRSIDNRKSSENNYNKDWYSKQTPQYSRHYNARTNHRNKNAMDPRRRQILENNRKRLELMRRNPYEYRRMLNERRKLQSSSRSNSVESSYSSEELRKQNNTSIKNSKLKSNNGDRPRKVKPRKRRRRRAKNCGTKQPRYQWKKRNEKREAEMRMQMKKYGNDKVIFTNTTIYSLILL